MNVIRIIPYIFGIIFVVIGVALFTQLTKEARIPAARWLWPVMVVQEHNAVNVVDEKGKIIIIAGSNALFGFDGAALESATGRKVVILALHAGLSLDFYRRRLEGFVTKNDVVIMPLEFSYYRRKGDTDFHQMQNMIWLHSVSGEFEPIVWLRENWRTRSEFLLRGLGVKVFKPAQSLDVYEREKIIADWRKGQPAKRYYDVSRVDRWGGLYVAKLMQGRALDLYKGKYKLVPPSVGSREFVKFVKEIKHIQHDVIRAGGSFFLAWPPLMDINNNASYAVFNHPEKFQPDLVEAEFKRHNISYVCGPEQSLLPPVMFFDTHVHLNALGATVRSIILGKCLTNEHKQEDEKLYQVTFDELRRARNNRDGSKFQWEVLLHDLDRVKKALEEYYTDHGVYPVSNGWMGVKSNFGESTKNWIPNLTPKYIDALPQPPKQKNFGHYLYKSDGKDYKITLRAPTVVHRLKQLKANTIDERRKSNSIGIWTHGARMW